MRKKKRKEKQIEKNLEELKETENVQDGEIVEQEGKLGYVRITTDKNKGNQKVILFEESAILNKEERKSQTISKSQKALNNLIDAQIYNKDTSAPRRILQDQYNILIRYTGGSIRDSLFKQDVDFPKMANLEKWQGKKKRKKKVGLADIFSKTLLCTR